MIKLFKVLIILLISYSSIYGQKNDYKYKSNTISELLGNEIWIKTNTQKYLRELEEKYAKHEIEKAIYLNKKIQSSIVLHQYKQGLMIAKPILQTEPDLLFGKSYLSILYAYLSKLNKNSHIIPAFKHAFKMANATELDWFEFENLMNNNYHGMSIMDYNTQDKNLIEQYFNQRIHSFKPNGGFFSFDEMGNIIRIYAFKKISSDIQKEIKKLTAEYKLLEIKNAKKPIVKIDKTLKAVFPTNEPGAAIVIMKGDSIVLQKGYGIADINSKKKVDSITNFNIGSISKMFTATAILILKNENKLSLKEPIIKYLPDLNPKIGSKINIYHLLTHSSGLPRYIEEKDKALELIAMDREVYENTKNIDSLIFEPGTSFNYSNIGYKWLAVIIENITKLKFADFVRANILIPANMRNSFELNRDAPLPNFAHAYQKKAGIFSEYDYGEEAEFSTLGDGGLVSNTADFIEWEMSLRHNTVFPKELYEESIKPQINSNIDTPNTHYGFGWFIQSDPKHKTVYSHSGGNGAFLSYFFRVPEKNIMCAIFMNRNDKFIIARYIQNLLEVANWY